MQLVRSCQVLQIRLGILWRDPPLKHHPARAPYREQVAIPLVLCRMGGRQAMRVMILDKRLEVSQPGHCVMRSYLAWRSQCAIPTQSEIVRRTADERASLIRAQRPDE